MRNIFALILIALGLSGCVVEVNHSHRGGHGYYEQIPQARAGEFYLNGNWCLGTPRRPHSCRPGPVINDYPYRREYGYRPSFGGEPVGSLTGPSFHIGGSGVWSSGAPLVDPNFYSYRDDHGRVRQGQPGFEAVQKDIGRRR